MKCREVRNNDGEFFTLTEVEERYIRAIERLEKMDTGRLFLFGNGQLSARLNGIGSQHEIIGFNIYCEGGDGGDRS